MSTAAAFSSCFFTFTVFVLMCAWNCYIIHPHLNKVAMICDGCGCKAARAELAKLLSCAWTVAPSETVHLRSGEFVFIRIVFSLLHDSSLRCPGEEQTALCAPPGAGSNVDAGRGSSGAFSYLVRPVTPPSLSRREPPVLSSSLPSDCLFASALPNLKGPSCAKGGLFAC